MVKWIRPLVSFLCQINGHVQKTHTIPEIRRRNRKMVTMGRLETRRGSNMSRKRGERRGDENEESEKEEKKRRKRKRRK